MQTPSLIQLIDILRCPWRPKWFEVKYWKGKFNVLFESLKSQRALPQLRKT